MLTNEEKYLFEKFVFRLDRSSNILDIGTGNGRFLKELAKNNFTFLHGIDLADRLLLVAMENVSPFRFIKFDKMSASNLTFGCDTFDAVIALQQIICFIDNAKERADAFRESSRVLKPQGLFIGSFLLYGSRWINPLISLLSFPQKLIDKKRAISSYQYLPWLKHGSERLNWKFLVDPWQPYLYWFKKSEIECLMKKNGIEIIEMRTSKEIGVGNNFFTGGMLYVVGRKK